MSACFLCSSAADRLEMTDDVAPGFGIVIVTRDGAVVCEEIESAPVADIESIAAERPNGDWRIEVDGPFRSDTYQRQGAGVWVLIETVDGFA